MRKPLKVVAVVCALLAAALIEPSVGARFGVRHPSPAPVKAVGSPTSSLPGAEAPITLSVDVPTPPTTGSTIDNERPTAGHRKHGLSSGALDDAYVNSAHRARFNARDNSGRAVVEVFNTLSSAEARSRVAAVGGTVTGEVPGQLVQADVPWDGLARLEASPGITFVRPPKRISIVPKDWATQAAAATAHKTPTTRHKKKHKHHAGPLVGEEVAKMNATAWHAAGKLGDGVKVGIVDVFSTKPYGRAAKALRVPQPAGTVCFVAGTPCSVFDAFGPNEDHGTAVTEIIHEMAPNAQIYLGSAITAADLQAVVSSFIASGVKIITRSLTSEYDGAGDGTGPIDTVVNNAITGGITWFNSAGNSAGGTSFPDSGAYYRGTFTDTNGNGLHEFSPGHELLGLPCFVFTNGLRWDDFNETGANVTDFDLIEFDQDGHEIDSSNDSQGSTGGSAPPLENFANGGTGCGPRNRQNRGLVFVAIKLVNPGSSPNDILEFQNNGQPMTFSSNAFSAAVPICDSANKGQVCVGAIDPALGTEIASYSSQGPTNDQRIKPDVSAAACVLSFTFFPCFNGTSSASPAAAGAAALALGAGLGGGTAAGLGDFVRGSVVDRGAPGPDPVYGTGEFILPAPPP